MIYPWLKNDWDTLTSMRKQKRLPHALMLVGPTDFGIESFAKTLANAILCEKGQENACGECRSCRLFRAGNHADYFQVQPAESEVIKVDVLREVCRSLTQKSARGGYQVVLIEQADKMQASSANALLKTLEEPEGDVLFILWVTRLEALPPTLRSRTQQFILGAGKVKEMQTWLSDKYELDSEKPWLKVACNRPLSVCSLQEDNYFLTRDKLIASLQAVKEKRKFALDGVDEFRNWNRSTYFYALISIAADGLRNRLQVSSTHWTNEDKEKEIEHLFEGLEPKQALDFYDCTQQIWRYEQLPQALNKTLLDCQIWLEWEKITEARYAH